MSTLCNKNKKKLRFNILKPKFNKKKIGKPNG